MTPWCSDSKLLRSERNVRRVGRQSERSTAHPTMIRTSDRKPTPAPSTCYEEAAQPAFGIAFEKQGGTRRFVPYAFLSALDFVGAGELTFRFSYGTVTVSGTALEALWKAACKGELARVWEGEQSQDSTAAWVREIVLSETEPGSSPKLPPFPQEPPKE